MGNAPDGAEVPYLLNDKIWSYMNALECGTTHVEQISAAQTPHIYPNPLTETMAVNWVGRQFKLTAYTITGQLLDEWPMIGSAATIDINFPPGPILLRFTSLNTGEIRYRQVIAH